MSSHCPFLLKFSEATALGRWHKSVISTSLKKYCLVPSAITLCCPDHLHSWSAIWYECSKSEGTNDSMNKFSTQYNSKSYFRSLQSQINRIYGHAEQLVGTVLRYNKTRQQARGFCTSQHVCKSSHRLYSMYSRTPLVEPQLHLPGLITWHTAFYDESVGSRWAPCKDNALKFLIMRLMFIQRPLTLCCSLCSYSGSDMPRMKQYLETTTISALIKAFFPWLLRGNGAETATSVEKNQESNNTNVK